MEPLDRDGCRALAEAIGDTPLWPIPVHALRTGRGRAFAIGDPRDFDAAVVAPDYCPDEPQAWGDPDGIRRILSQLSGWTAVEVPRAYVLEEFRGRGLATAAAALVTRAVLAAGQTAVWSTGATNVASQSVARKLGSREVARTSYVVVD